jgi:hypothetical protein
MIYEDFCEEIVPFTPVLGYVAGSGQSNPCHVIFSLHPRRRPGIQPRLREGRHRSGIAGIFTGQCAVQRLPLEDYKDKLQGSSDAIMQQQYKDKLQMYRERRTSDIWWMGVTCVLSMLDAYVDAHLADFEGEKDKLHLRFSDDQVQLELKF